MNGRATVQFVRQLQRVLRYLYDPVELGKSALLGLLGLEGRRDPPTALRNSLVEAIESLRPPADVPPQSTAWRLYHILTQRYVEQFTQREVAANLALSTRQLGRLEKRAIRVLADHLYSRHGVALLAARPDAASARGAEATARVGGATPSREQELRWLKASCPNQPATCAELLEAALEVAAPLARTLGVRTTCQVPQGLPPLSVQLTAMRQALLNILTAAIHSVPGGTVSIEARACAPQVWILVRSTPKHLAARPPLPEDEGESLQMADELIRLSGGSLEVLPAGDGHTPFAVRIVLPVLEQVSVLVVDDNADTLHLLERYLAGSRYRFVGTADPQQALALAEKVGPQIVVLDVMLPGVDGWELLARFREHPRLRESPLIVCTILPQEELARALGAVALIRKPVTQPAFLAALDQQWERLARGSR